MDAPARSRPTSAQLTVGSESPAAGAITKPSVRRLSADATSSLSLEGSTSSSGSVGQTDAISSRQSVTATVACPSGSSDSTAAAAAVSSPHHQAES